MGKMKHLQLNIARSFCFVSLTSIQGYWAMSDYAAGLSVVYGPLEETLLAWGLLLLPVHILLWWLARRLKVNLVIAVCIATVLVSAVWLNLNRGIFIEREASWSTYSASAVWSYSLYLSQIPVIVCGIAYAVLMTLFYRFQNNTVVSP
jgi:peptidoglycan/LPS O-acetylase OafA/YrhL